MGGEGERLEVHPVSIMPLSTKVADYQLVISDHHCFSL